MGDAISAGEKTVLGKKEYYKVFFNKGWTIPRLDFSKKCMIDLRYLRENWNLPLHNELGNF